MFQLANLNDEVLKRFVRSLSSGELLFEMGEMGNTMFIIIQGTMEMLEERGTDSVVVNVVGPGEVIGEKAILSESPYKRGYTARAKSEVTLLEFESKSIRLIEAVIPNFTHRILQMAASRLDRANHLIRVLRSLDPVERIIKCIQFLASQHGVKTSEGVEVNITIHDIYNVIYVEKQTIEFCLNQLTNKKILRKTKSGFLLTDANAMDQYASELRERVAA